MPFRLDSTYLAMDGKGALTELPVGPDFWQTIDRNPAARGTLVTMGESEGDWPHWEMHPKGDELVMLLDGAATMIFERHAGDEHIPLMAGEAIVVPRGVWHRALVQRKSRMLFATFGEGTQHKPVTAK